MNKFAERLKESLSINKISQRELARRIEMSQSSVNSYCLGKREPSLDALILVCRALDETSDYMLGIDKR